MPLKQIPPHKNKWRDEIKGKAVSFVSATFHKCLSRRNLHNFERKKIKRRREVKTTTTLNCVYWPFISLVGVSRGAYNKIIIE